MSATDPVRDLIAERGAVRALIGMWAALDSGQYEGVATSFAEDGVWLRQGKELKGPAMVRAAMAERSKGARTRHVVTNMLTTLQGDAAAEINFYMTVFSHGGAPDAPPPAPMNVPNTVGPGRVTLRLEDGQWKITELKTSPTFKRA